MKTILDAIQYFYEKNMKFPNNFYKKFNHQQRYLIFRLVIAGTTVVVSTIAYLCYHHVRASLLNHLKQSALLEVKLGVNQVDEWLAMRKAETETIANSPTFRTMDWLKVRPYLESEVERLENFYYLTMVNPNGSYYATHQGLVNANIKDRPHIQEALTGKVVGSDPVISRLQGFPAIVIVSPVWSDAPTAKKIIGVHAGVISIDRVSEVVKALNYGRNSYAFALNSQGVPIVHPDRTLMGTTEKPAASFLTSENLGLRQISPKMVQQKSKIQLIQLNGELVYVAYVPLNQANWSIALVIPRQNIESQLRPLNFMVLVIVVLAIATILVLWQLQYSENQFLKKSKEAADAANQGKSIFLANMSHELRTPLNVMLGFTQLLGRDRTLSQEAQESLKTISRAGEHLLELIDDILNLAQIEAGTLSLNLSNFCLDSLLDTLEKMFKLQTETKNLYLQVSREQNFSSCIKTDAKKLRQVLINLMNNAIKFTDKGGVTVRVKLIDAPKTHRETESSSSNSEASEYLTIQFEVEDTGKGISPNELHKLFQAFVQTETGRKSEQGTGLGLTISQKFIQLMGGEITVKSQVGQGSLFQFYIQVLPGDAAEMKQASPSRKAIALAPGQRIYKILVVDDRWSNRQLLIKLLKPFGFEIQEAENGAIAVKLWQTWQPHLIFMDMRMPVMNGYEATREIKAHLPGQATVIIALSANVFDEERSVILSAGCDDFVRKPFLENTILEKIAEHLGVKYVYEDDRASLSDIRESHQGNDFQLSEEQLRAVCTRQLKLMPTDWIDKLHLFAQQLDRELIMTLLEEIPPEQSDLAEAIAYWSDNFRYDIIIELTQVK